MIYNRMHPANASAVIRELIQAGLVFETVADRLSMVALNRSHLAAGPVLALASLRGELVRRILRVGRTLTLR